MNRGINVNYSAIAFDYDGTLAKDGIVSDAVIQSLRDLSRAGLKLLIVSGRILEDLQSVFPQMAMFDKVVVENGAVLHTPSSNETRLLTHPAPIQLYEKLTKVGAEPTLGLAVVATWRPFEKHTRMAIQRLGLNHTMIFNKGALMVLPPGVDKATGLNIALDELGLLPEQTIAVGDAENDLSMFSMVGLPVAVANALPLVKQHAAMVTSGDHGEGVIEVCEKVLAGEPAEMGIRSA